MLGPNIPNAVGARPDWRMLEMVLGTGRGSTLGLGLLLGAASGEEVAVVMMSVSEELSPSPADSGLMRWSAAELEECGTCTTVTESAAVWTQACCRSSAESLLQVTALTAAVALSDCCDCCWVDVAVDSWEVVVIGCV